MNTTAAPPLTQQVAARVQKAMESAGVSQLRLSEETGIARATLIRRLAGRSPFRVDELEAIAAVLECSAASLLAAAA